MSRPTKQTYKNDLTFQGLFYLPMMFLYVVGFIVPGAFFLGMILQFFVGISQVLSGAIHSVRYEDKVHKRYFMLAIGYLAFLFLGGMFLESMAFRATEVLLLFFLFVIPVGIATWYYRLTWLGYKNADTAFSDGYQDQPFQEDILDDVLFQNEQEM